MNNSENNPSHTAKTHKEEFQQPRLECFGEPRLERLGNLRELTRSKAGSNGDSNVGTGMSGL